MENEIGGNHIDGFIRRRHLAKQRHRNKTRGISKSILLEERILNKGKYVKIF